MKFQKKARVSFHQLSRSYADTCEVLGPHTRAFNVVFEGAQQKLRKTFGMELVEVPTRAALDEENAADEELDDIRQATGVRKKGIYVLAACLRVYETTCSCIWNKVVHPAILPCPRPHRTSRANRSGNQGCGS